MSYPERAVNLLGWADALDDCVLPVVARVCVRVEETVWGGHLASSRRVPPKLDRSRLTVRRSRESNARWLLLSDRCGGECFVFGIDSADALPNAIRLVDLFDAEAGGRVQPAPASAPTRTDWRFDGRRPASVPAKFAATHGWQAGPGVAGLAVQSGQLSGAFDDRCPRSFISNARQGSTSRTCCTRSRSACAHRAERTSECKRARARRSTSTPMRAIGARGLLATAVAAAGGRRVSDLRADASPADRRSREFGIWSFDPRMPPAPRLPSSRSGSSVGASTSPQSPQAWVGRGFGRSIARRSCHMRQKRCSST